MANKRMFNLKIIDSDAFLDMPLSTQCLYFHLNMRADDDGFVGNPKRIQRLIGASDDDLKLLIAKRFLLVFEDGVIVIKHWKLHNTIQKDRYTKTVYTDELKQLGLKENKAYTFDVNKMETKCIQNVSTDIDIDKDIDLGIDKGLDKGTDKDKKNKRETFVSILDAYTQNNVLKSSLSDFVDMRKKMKGFTIRALKLSLKKLDELSKYDNEKIDIVNQSVMNGWKTFYELKNSDKKKYPDWYSEGTQKKTKEDSIKSLEKAYQTTIKMKDMGIIDDSEFEKRKDDYNKMYLDLTGKDIESVY